MIDLEISRMTADDLDDIMEIERKSFGTAWSRWMFERELVDEKRSHFLVARNESGVIGYIGFWMAKEDEAHIVTIAVKSDFRRQGVGSMLMASALVWAMHLDADKATLEVRVTNIPAQDLYEKFGFKVVAIRRKFYSDTGEDAYIMWLYDLKNELK